MYFNNSILRRILHPLFAAHGTAGHAAEEFVAAAEREKQEMQHLNVRLEAYISRVRQLEDRNKELVVELDSLRGSLGNDIGAIKV